MSPVVGGGQNEGMGSICDLRGQIAPQPGQTVAWWWSHMVVFDNILKVV